MASRGAEDRSFVSLDVLCGRGPHSEKAVMVQLLTSSSSNCVGIYRGGRSRSRHQTARERDFWVEVATWRLASFHCASGALATCRHMEEGGCVPALHVKAVATPAQH